jgi:hypothetical protein
MTATAERSTQARTRVTARAPKPSRERVLFDLLSTAATWQPFRGPTGTLFWRVPGSADGVTYTVSPDSCTCPSEEHRRTTDEICKHRRAVQLYAFLGQTFAIQLRRLEAIQLRRTEQQA